MSCDLERLHPGLDPVVAAAERNVGLVFETPGTSWRPKALKLTEKHLAVGERHRQLYPHGTEAWAEAYARRTAVERFFSYLKLWTAVDWDDIRVHGIAKRALMVVAAVIYVNQRLIDKYRAGQLTEATPDPIEVGAPPTPHPAGPRASRRSRPAAEPPPLAA